MIASRIGWILYLVINGPKNSKQIENRSNTKARIEYRTSTRTRTNTKSKSGADTTQNVKDGENNDTILHYK